MGRPAKFTDQAILDAAAALVAAGGPAAATMAAIGAALGAPNASIYHRFGSRDELLGRLWLQKAARFQDRFEAALALDDPLEAGLAAALSLPAAVRDDLPGARLMLLHRRADFEGPGWPAEMTREAERLKRQVASVLAAATDRLFGRNGPAERETATFALLDLPFATVHRHVAAGRRPPPQADDWIRRTYEAVVAAPLRASGSGARSPR